MGWGVSRVALMPSSDKHGTLAYVTAPPNFEATQAQLRGLMHTRSQGNARDELCSHLPAGHGELMLLHHGMGRSAVEWQVTQGLRAMNLRTPPLFQYLSWLHQCNRGNANCLPANEAAAHLVTLQLQWDGTVRPSNLSATTTTPRQAPVREEDTSTRGDTMETGGDHEVDREETHRRAAQQFTTEAASVHARPTHGRHAVQRCTPQGQSPPAETPGQLLLTAVKSRSVYFRCCGVWPVARPVGHSRGSQRARLRFVVARVQSWCPLKTTCTRSDLLEVLVLRDVDGPYVLERVCHCPCPADEQTADHPVHCRYKELLQAAVPAALNTLQTLEVPGDARAAHVPVTLPNPPQTLGWDAVLREDVAAVTGNGGTVVCITSIRGQHVYFTTTYNEVASAHATRVHTVSLNRTTKKYRCACSAPMTKYNTKRLQKQPKQRDCVHIRAVRQALQPQDSAGADTPSSPPPDTPSSPPPATTLPAAPPREQRQPEDGDIFQNDDGVWFVVGAVSRHGSDPANYRNMSDACRALETQLATIIRAPSTSTVPAVPARHRISTAANVQAMPRWDGRPHQFRPTQWDIDEYCGRHPEAQGVHFTEEEASDIILHCTSGSVIVRVIDLSGHDDAGTKHLVLCSMRGTEITRSSFYTCFTNNVGWAHTRALFGTHKVHSFTVQHSLESLLRCYPDGQAILPTIKDYRTFLHTFVANFQNSAHGVHSTLCPVCGDHPRCLIVDASSIGELTRLHYYSDSSPTTFTQAPLRGRCRKGIVALFKRWKYPPPSKASCGTLQCGELQPGCEGLRCSCRKVSCTRGRKRRTPVLKRSCSPQ